MVRVLAVLLLQQCRRNLAKSWRNLAMAFIEFFRSFPIKAGVLANKASHQPLHSHCVATCDLPQVSILLIPALQT
jgi:hypothetical protein